jgi:hypothetical protein
MARLFGAQKMVLQAIQDAPKDAGGFVSDDQVALSTRIALNEVRDWFETLEGDGYVEVARTEGGFSSNITAKGRLTIRLPPGPRPQGESGQSVNRFLSPFVQQNALMVLGRFLERFRRFEASGLVGFGDAMASVELRGALEILGARNVQLSWASQLQGRSLSDNLILLGGPNNNLISRKFLGTINPTFSWPLDDSNVIGIRDIARSTVYNPTISWSDEGTSTDYGIIISHRNPFSCGGRALLIAGCFGFGTWAGARFISSSEFLDNEVVSSGSPFECLVEAQVFLDAPQTIKMIEVRQLE